MGRGAGQAHARGHAADCGDELVHLVPHQQAAVAGLGALAVLDLNGAGIFLHLGDGVDDLVPAEVAAGDLQDDIFEETGAEQPRGATTLTGAHAHRHVHLLVQVGHAHLQAFPHVGGERAEGHAADQQGVDLANGRYPVVLLEVLEAFLGGTDAPQQGADVELVTAGVQGRVGEHGDTDELDLIQHALGVVAAAAASAGLSATIVVEFQRGGCVFLYRADGVVGADHVAHAAADAGVCRIVALTDAVIDAGCALGLAVQTQGDVKGALAVHAEFDGVYRTDRGATSAQGAGC